MKKKLLVFAALYAFGLSNAQILTHIDNTSLFYIGEGALMFSGGGLQTKGTGFLDIRGNVMVVGSGNDQFSTLDNNGAKKTVADNNIVLRLNDRKEFNSYGQLYISGLTQPNINGFVTKEYLSVKHGDYQQMGLPFYNKLLSTLSSELGTLTNNRWTKTEVLNFDNLNVVSASIPLSANTSSTGNNSFFQGYITKSNSYYMIGTANWNPFSANTDASIPPGGVSSTYKVYNIKGIPNSEGAYETLSNAGVGIDFGTNGANYNAYRETYNSYLKDAWAVAKNETWTGNYGRNIYQFGNPYFTNLDLSQIVGADGSTIGDGNDIKNILGIRYNSSGVIFDRTTGTNSSSASASCMTTFANGQAIGDAVPIIKPMGFFVIKLSDNSPSTLNFDTLRRFKYTRRAATTNYSVSSARMVQKPTVSSGKIASANTVAFNPNPSSSFVKQIALVALDAANNEIGRTYYAVYPTAESGQSSVNTGQAAASSANIIGSFEELKTGGIDTSLQNSYWLYINVANDQDFIGKEIPVRVYSDAVKSIKVEIKEDGQLVPDNTSKLSSGESFYLGFGASTKPLSQGEVLPLASSAISLYYGTPSGTLNVSTPVSKPSETIVVYDESISKYIILFDSTWKRADVTVYDMSGKIISSASKVDAQKDYSISLPNVEGVYVVTAVSESGVKFVQKIKK